MLISSALCHQRTVSSVNPCMESQREKISMDLGRKTTPPSHDLEHNEWWTRYARMVRSILARRVPAACSEEVDDLAQETWLRAWRKKECLREPGLTRAWLAGIAVRVAKEWHVRRRKRHVAVEHAEDFAAPDQARPSRRALELAEAIEELPEPFRCVTKLRYVRGLSCQETAEQLGVPLGTVTKRLSRAHALLKEKLTRRWGLEDQA